MDDNRPLDDSRQRDLVPPEKLARVHGVVVGVGAVGRQAALQLASVGVESLSLIDPDTVGEENLLPQAYRAQDLGKDKVVATRETVRYLSGGRVRGADFAERWARGSAGQYLALGSLNCVFCCVDSVSSRKVVWESAGGQADFFCDARVGGGVVRVLTGGPSYPGTLFQPEEAYRGSCTSKMTVYLGSLAASLMLNQWARWLRGAEVEPDLTLNTVAMELTV